MQLSRQFRPHKVYILWVSITRKVYLALFVYPCVRICLSVATHSSLLHINRKQQMWPKYRITAIQSIDRIFFVLCQDILTKFPTTDDFYICNMPFIKIRPLYHIVAIGICHTGSCMKTSSHLSNNWTYQCQSK